MLDRINSWFRNVMPRFLDFFLPPHLRGLKRDDVESLRMLASFTIFYILVVFNNIGQYLYFGLQKTAIINIISGIIACFCLLLIRFKASYRPTALTVLITGFSSMMGGIYLTGGWQSPVLVWCVAAPFITVWVLGVRAGIVVIIFDILAIIGIFFVEPSHIGLSSEPFPDEVARVFAMTHYVIASLFFLLLAYLFVRKNDRMLRIVEDRNNSIATIINHVKSGFLMIDAFGIVQPGYSQSCKDLFGKDIEGLSLPRLLCSDERSLEHFTAALDQVFNGLMPAKVSLATFREFYQVNNRNLRMQSDIVKQHDGSVGKILLTFSDATAYIKSLEKERTQNMLLSVLAQKELFMDFVVNFSSNFVQMHAALLSGNEVEVRNILHTIKGNAAVLGLTVLVDLIHSLEGQERINDEDLINIKQYLERFSDRFKQIVAIDFKELSDFEVYLDQKKIDVLKTLPPEIDNPKFKEHITNWLWQIRSKPIFDLLNIYYDFVSSLASELGKHAVLKQSGANISIDAATWRILNQHIPTLLRNAVYHGIESPDKRRKKPKVGTIEIHVEKTQSNLLRVSVIDDGKGMDIEAIKNKLLSKHILNQSQIEKLSDFDLYQYVFDSGFTTVESADVHAGRGLGISASMQALKQVGATLELRSKAGEGSNFTIVLDLQTKGDR